MCSILVCRVRPDHAITIIYKHKYPPTVLTVHTDANPSNEKSPDQLQCTIFTNMKRLASLSSKFFVNFQTTKYSSLCPKTLIDKKCLTKCAMTIILVNIKNNTPRNLINRNRSYIFLVTFGSLSFVCCDCTVSVWRMEINCC